ncbi:MAG TPA: glycoside hydrolase domain-containing protein [Bacteroidota bacterium]|nr:glycoside hydrolase domain-containing protein [Bacteroidota bacterium]
MKRDTILFSSILVLLLATVAASQEGRDSYFPGPADYGTGTWNSDSLGNHRVIIKVTQKSDAVVAHIPWRRRDEEPEKKGIYIFDAFSGKRIANAIWTNVNREFGDVVFQPSTIPSEYYVYYLLYRAKPAGNYPHGFYLPPQQTADSSWLRTHRLDDPDNYDNVIKSLPKAQFVQFQSIDQFNSFYPMEVIATKAEVERILKMNKRLQYLLFPEDRKDPIRMTTDLPAKWFMDGARTTFNGFAHKGEFYSFQIGLYAARTSIEGVKVTAGDLKQKEGGRIPSSAFTSFNTEGIDWQGNEFGKTVKVEQGHVQALWMGIQVPQDIESGSYTGEITVAPSGLKASKVKVRLDVSDHILADAGDAEPTRMSRLRWLNSQLAVDDSIVKPFVPMTVRDSTVSCLGRSVVVASSGLLRSIVSYFSPENTSLLKTGRDVLAAPIQFVVENSRGSVEKWKYSGIQFTKKAQGAIAWTAVASAGSLDMQLEAHMEFDGYVDFRVTFTAKENTSVKDIRLEIPVMKSVAKYWMGMGLKGGNRPDSLSWQWDVKQNQDAFWTGDVNAGIACSFRDENYVRPLNTNFYLLKPLKMPPSWYNEGNGGFRFGTGDTQALVLRAFSGARKVKAGDKLHFYFSLMLTPFKLIDTDAQWSTRYYHKYGNVKEIAAIGANTVNVHHATSVNPYLNYPFLRPKEMKAYVDSAHALGMKVKIYYTVRELSDRAPEIFTLRSLGDEVLSYGKGGGSSWLLEHMDQDYIAGWYVPELNDASLITNGVSRWHNYYVEGLNWLAKNVGIDGLYIDDVAFDRTTMKRVRKVLDRNRPDALIDLHSANQFNPRDGYINSALLYMEHFPYINRLWFGEYFDYDSKPDYWLTEISGIPFGLMGEMLEKGGNPWRGMVYGMTNRLPWSGDPRPEWKLWDEFGMSGTKMFGYWSDNCPVKTDNPSVLATAYAKPGSALISLASWASDTVNCSLSVDWKSLGLDTVKVRMEAPAVKNFQDARSFRIGESIPVPPGKGWLLEVKQQ